ncbi:MAG TPA: hypothetical protein PK878_08625 [bacterium]|nr:hypothetical protein [bacterium]HOL95496.1 hypothetical protein [bacterium]
MLRDSCQIPKRGWIHLSLAGWIIVSSGLLVQEPWAQPIPAGNLLKAHAHNDYEHTRPLVDALEQRFYSVEADIWLVEEEILVSHDPGHYKGSLKQLYLDPLRDRVEKHGSVHGDGQPFWLWIDIKDGRDALRPVLHNLLKNYVMLTTFSESGMKTGPVTVILTGDAKSKEAYCQEYSIRYACRDSNDYAPDDPSAGSCWTWYALKWANYIRWYGDEEIQPGEYEKLVQLVQDIHAKGRRVRFWAAPDHERSWALLLKAGVDLINTDKLEELRAFLSNTQPSSAPE